MKNGAEEREKKRRSRRAARGRRTTPARQEYTRNNKRRTRRARNPANKKLKKTPSHKQASKQRNKTNEQSKQTTKKKMKKKKKQNKRSTEGRNTQMSLPRKTSGREGNVHNNQRPATNTYVRGAGSKAARAVALPPRGDERCVHPPQPWNQGPPHGPFIFGHPGKKSGGRCKS